MLLNLNNNANIFGTIGIIDICLPGRRLECYYTYVPSIDKLILNLITNYSI